MYIRTPVIGIPKWPWKKELLKLAIKQNRVFIVDITDFCFTCSRHFKLLQAIDRGDVDLLETEYCKYLMKKYNRVEIKKRIKHVNKIYKSIRNNGCIKPPIITDDGCRLDGSHRLSILIHLGVKKNSINIVRYEDLYNKKKSNLIRQKVNEYRKKVLNL